MNKYIYILILILSLSFVSAVDNQLLTIDKCYNVSIHVRLLSGTGNSATYNMLGMTQNGNDWFIDCRNLGNWNLTFHPNDLTDLESNEWRHYEFTGTIYQYRVNSSKTTIVMTDYGSHSQIMGKQLDDQGEDKIVVYEPYETIVYKDKIINNTIEVIKEVPIQNITYIEVEKNISIYYENTTKINEWIDNYNGARKGGIYFLILCGLEAIAILLLIFKYVRKKA